MRTKPATIYKSSKSTYIADQLLFPFCTNLVMYAIQMYCYYYVANEIVRYHFKNELHKLLYTYFEEW